MNPCAVRAFVVGDNLVRSFQSSLPAHHSATNAGTSPSGGFGLARLCLKSDGLMIDTWTCKPGYLLIVAAPAEHTTSS